LSAWALLVSDLQNDFLDRGGYYGIRARLQDEPGWRALSSTEQARRLDEAAASTSRGVVSADAERMINRVADAVACARRADRPVGYVRAVYDRGFDILPPGLHRDPERRHHPCHPGTWGAGFVDPIRRLVEEDRAPRERVFDKHTYDAFFRNPALAEFLDQADIGRLYVCGTETQTCVLASAQHAALLGYHTTILEDAVWSADTRLGRAALDIHSRAFGDTCAIDALG